MIDCNVIATANNKATHVDREGAATAARFLLEVADGSHTMLDDSRDWAANEYKRHASFAGRPGAGDHFFLWYYRNRANPDVIEKIWFDETRTVASFLPAALLPFDDDDHKWLAIYFEGRADTIVNATDSDWNDDAVLLSAHGVRVMELLVA